MSEYITNRQRQLKIGISSYTENDLVLDVIGNVNITGITTLGGVKISSGIITSSSSSGIITYYGDGSKLSNISVTSSTASYASTAGISTLAQGLTGVPNLNVGVVIATEYYGTFRGDVNIAGYASTSGIATYASSAGISTYASSSGVSTYASRSGIATYSNSSGIATYSSTAGVSTYASTAGIATYATTAGISTYAVSSGIATNIKGGSSGDILYQSAPNTTNFVNAASAAPGQVLIWNGTVPSWDNVTSASGAFGGITVKDEGNTVGTIKSITTLNFVSPNLSVTASSGANGVATITMSNDLVGTGLSFSGISTLGVVTATDYYGVFKGTLDPTVVAGYALTAGISTVARGLTGTPNLNVGIVTATEYYGIFKGTINADVIANSAATAGYANTAGVSTALKNPRTFEITGDVVASPISFDGTGNVSLAATIQPNSVALGTDTTGDYVQSVSGTLSQITVTGGTGEGSTPTIGIANNATLPGNVTISNDLQVNRNLNVNGNITIGGTSAYIIVNDFRVKDADIVLGFATDSYGNDVSNDTTANHGGVSVASTEGSPLISIYNPGIGETTPATYKKIMWFKSGSFAGLNTDAWLINYAVGIGSTQFPSGTRLAAGSVQFTENDLAVVRNINASGVVTATSFSGNASSASYASTSGISTLARGLTGTPNLNVGIVTATEYYGIFKGTINADVVANTANYASVSGIATYAVTAGVSTYATSSGISTYASTAGIATYATSSGIATYATSSGIATYASTAGIATYASTAGIATYATSSGIATYASTAGIATSVIGGISSVSQLIVSGISTLNTVQISSGIITATSGIVTYYGDGSKLININSSSIVGVTSYATSSGIATVSQGLTGTPNLNVGIVTAIEYYGIFKGTINADVIANTAVTAGYANTAGIATYASTAGIATYATSSGIATYASTAGIATYASTSGIATVSQGLTGTPSISVTNLNVSGISTLGTVQVSSGIVTATSGIVTYYGDGSKLSGISVSSVNYAATSGVATSVIGGIGSITSLSVSGITTTSTLQVGTGGTIITTTSSGLVGIGTTNPSLNLDVNGRSRISGNSLASTPALRMSGTWFINGSNASTTPHLFIAPTAAGDGSWQTSGTALGINAESGFTGRFLEGQTAGASKFYIDRNGSVKTTMDFELLSSTGNIFLGGGRSVIDASDLGVIRFRTYPGNIGFERLVFGSYGGNQSPSIKSTTSALDSNRASISFRYGDDSGACDISAKSAIFSGITSAANLRITGISTLGTVQVSSGIVTATSGIVTYYGDGSKLTGISVTSVNYAEISGIATYASTAGISTYATSSGIATYASTAGIATYATSSGIATYASTAGISTYATSSGIATYASTAGIATYASTAGVATALQNTRTFEITGDIIASPVSFDGTGNVSLAATIQPNSVALGTDTTGDYVQSISGTSNQITVTGGTGEGSTPTLSIPNQFTAPQDVTVTRDLQVNRNLNVNGNITIGGTSATLFTTEFKVYDPDIVLGFRTDGSGNDVSTDNTANHGGIAIASTEGSPLIQLYDVGIGETNPATYKKIMWFKSGSFTGLNTDAWLINYAVGIGSTQFPTGTRLAAGSVQFTENDLAVVRNINASGIVTASSFVGNLTGTATTANNLSDAANITTGIIDSARLSGSYDINVSYANTAGISTVAQGLTGTPSISVANINASGIVTASSFIGSGTSLTDVRIGINSGGVNLGTANIINFTGAGISTITVSAGIATVNIPRTVKTRNFYIATAGQTVFSASYGSGDVDVYLNGAKLSLASYTANNGSTIVLNEGASLNDEIEIIGYTYQSDINTTKFLTIPVRSGSPIVITL